MKLPAIIALVIVTVASTTIACSPAESNAHPVTTTSASSPTQLDGLRFTTSAVLPNGRAVSSDISFKEGMFDSTACREMGFAPGRYTVAPTGDGAVVFHAEVATTDEPPPGVIEMWSGRIVGDKITGTVTTSSGVVINYQGTAL